MENNSSLYTLTSEQNQATKERNDLKLLERTVTEQSQNGFREIR